MEVINNVANCSMVYDYTDGVLTVTLTADEGYVIERAYIEYYYEGWYFKEVEFEVQGKTATLTAEGVEEESITIEGTTVESEGEGEGEGEGEVEIVHNLTNCTTNIPEGYIAQGTTIEIIVTANEGTEFTAPPKITYRDENGFYNSLPMEVNGNTASISITLGDFSDFIIWGDCEVVEVIGKDYGAINVYKVTEEQVSEFANKRFVKVTSTDPDTDYTTIETIDLGRYVDRIKRLYVPITDGASDVIRCGEYNTNIACVQPREDRVLLDFGTVTIPYYNGDVVDYEANIKMFLPFIGFIDINVSYIGRELRLIYDVNVITGFAVGKLYCDDMLVHVFDAQPSTNVIYKVVSDSVSTIGSNTFDEHKHYGLEPFIIIERYESVAPERNNDSEVGRIGDFKGYSRFIDVGLIQDPKMLMSEQELIYDTLRQGVYIE
jgi:hypothetical protein